jgi:hypothetical protein
LAAAVMAIVGAAIGVSARHTNKEAASAQQAAEQRAYTAARSQLTVRGKQAGFRAGMTAGTRAGQRAGSAAASAQKKATAVPKGVQNCPKTPIRSKSFVSSVNGISCAAAASEQLKALKGSHPTRTPGGFTCTRLDKVHYRCTKGAQAYRWQAGP